MQTPLDRVTQVISAGTTVVAGQQHTRLAAIGRVTAFHPVAKVPVAAIQRLSGNAPNVRVATLLPGAHVAVIASQLGSAHTLAVQANVFSRAHIVIVAGCGVVAVLATQGRVAGIIGARVVVSALLRDPWNTGAGIALVSHGAGISVVAGESFVMGNKIALTSGRVALHLLTDGVRPGGDLGTGHLSGRIYRALVRQLGCVAYQRTVAQIPVLQCVAIGIHHAFAIHLVALAGRVKALVRDGAWIAIIAISAVGRKLAPTEPIT